MLSGIAIDNMLLWIIIVGIVGLILLISEALMPGFGIFGILGTVCVLGSTVMAGIKYGFGIFLILVAALIILALIFVRVAQTKRVYDKFVLKEVLDTKDFDESILKGMEGKKGVTVTTIQPYGKMEIEGKQIDVRSEGGYIEKNKSVEIVQVKGKTVVVKEVVS